MTVARAALVAVGVVSAVLALAGFWYNFTSISADFSHMLPQIDAPYFYQAFYTMSAICLACYCLLLYIGVQLIRSKTNMVTLLTLLLLAEVLYFFAVGSLWMMPEYGMSIAAATGVANGGLMFQAFTLFPLWAPAVAFFASRSLCKSEIEGRDAQNSV
jgi:hypothetical protein